MSEVQAPKEKPGLGVFICKVLTSDLISLLKKKSLPFTAYAHVPSIMQEERRVWESKNLPKDASINYLSPEQKAAYRSIDGVVEITNEATMDHALKIVIKMTIPNSKDIRTDYILPNPEGTMFLDPVTASELGKNGLQYEEFAPTAKVTENDQRTLEILRDKYSQRATDVVPIQEVLNKFAGSWEVI